MDDILLVDVGGNLIGSFANFAEGDNVGFGRRITYQFGDGNDIGLVSIPEPASAAILSRGNIAFEKNSGAMVLTS